MKTAVRRSTARPALMRAARVVLFTACVAAQLGAGKCSGTTTSGKKPTVGATAASKPVLLGRAVDTTTPVPGTTSTHPDSAGQLIYGARSVLTNRGVTRGVLTADSAYAYNDATRLELRRVAITFLSDSGVKVASLTARTGKFVAPSSQTDARDSVVVLTEDGRRLQSAHVTFDVARNMLTGDSQFVYTETSGRRLTGLGFEADPQLRKVKVAPAVAAGAGTSTTVQPGKR